MIKMTPYKVAAKDISKYQIENGMENISVGDQWTVTIGRLQTKETRRLNRELGLHKINKQNN